ncbi:hypothetical protein BSKO_10773 [Bryopsis sp. KO-2023]|nr:hypothetical protein BSKO_10773 [Bryopsis sp. KO-2023]
MTRLVSPLPWDEFDFDVSGEPSPRPRYSATVTVVGDPILIGGTDGSQSFADAWRLGCGTMTYTWERLRDPPSQFEGRHNHCAVDVRTRSGNVLIWIFGGLCKTHRESFATAWTFSPAEQTWSSITLKEGARWLRRWGHSAIRCPNNPQKIWVFGGVHPDTREFTTDLFEIDTSELSIMPILKAAASMPISPRGYCTLTVDQHQNLIFFGGLGRSGESLTAYAQFNAVDREWKEFKPQQGKFYHHGAIQIKRRLLMIGGVHLKGEVELAPNLLMEVDLDKRLEVKRIESVELLPGRIQHCVFQLEDYMYVVGGRQTLTSPKSFQLPPTMLVYRLCLEDNFHDIAVMGCQFPATYIKAQRMAEEELLKAEKIRKLQAYLTKTKEKVENLTKDTSKDSADNDNAAQDDYLLEFPSQDETIARLSTEIHAMQQAQQSASKKALIFGE